MYAMMGVLSGFLVLSALGAVFSHDLGRISIDPDNHWFKDEDGRVIILRGVNSVWKEHPWYQDALFEDFRMDDLVAFGFNIMRLGAMWTGAEPEMGVFNRTYFEVEEQLVNRLADHGVYSMLDMHQDCLSGYYPPSYDGVPKWLIDLFPEPTNEHPWPLDEITQWEQNYLTQAVSEGFQHIYNDTEEAHYYWGRFWEEMALYFHENPAVLGYNYMNEPWIGDYISHGNLLLPGVAGKQNLVPVYDYLTEVVRDIEDTGLIFYDPVFYGQLFSNETIGSGFDRVPGGEGNEHLSAYSWHAYCWFLEFMDKNATIDDKLEAIQRCENWLIPKKFQSAHETVERTGGVSILTEYGICNGWDDFEYEPPWFECENYLDLADEYLESWTEWQYVGSWYRGETRLWGKILPHIRPYPRATAGVPTYTFFNRTTLEFNFDFDVDPSFDVPTEVFVPSMRYINGFEVEVSDNLEYEVDGDLLFLSPGDDVDDVQAASVTITAVDEGVNQENFRDYYPA